MKYTIEWLNTQQNIDFLFFWGHQPSKDGSVIKTCFSQWWPAAFRENEHVFLTAEHYMMSKKSQLFGDNETFERILKKTSPKDVKDLGRQVKNFDAAIWDEHKYQIVKDGNFLKFSQNEQLKQFLLQTNFKVIVEASPVDKIWGIGLSEDAVDAKDPKNWKGQNLLGFALMEVRDKINE
jgi:ribA/ribD-fused uncharacterized protein